ncbi:MAG: DUF1972 domain-containing protein [Roseiarcus sp.]|jgi:glycosyltransferase involved in cell wall biosynthesis
MDQAKRSILILGTRGVPANHGGFETFAERLALFLSARGWDVSVYCQENVANVESQTTVSMWRGIRRICVQVANRGPVGTLDFDWKCVKDAATRPGICLVLGYNTGILFPYLRWRGRKILANMDGIEWRRAKWGCMARAWFWLNEWIAAWSSNRLVADHPAIADHLATRRSRSAAVVIPYGGDPVSQASDAPVRALGLEPDRYLVSIARIEPDNNIHTFIEAFLSRPRGARLVMLGLLDERNAYHRFVRELSRGQVLFPGAIYDREVTQSLRFHCRAYLHGHTVGGTNPSLVESLWAGNAVLAHDNVYNRWTAGEAALFFKDAAECDVAMTRLLSDDALVHRCAAAALDRARTVFSWNDVCLAYERECETLIASKASEVPDELAMAPRQWT